jgi:hypothetical protein
MPAGCDAIDRDPEKRKRHALLANIRGGCGLQKVSALASSGIGLNTPSNNVRNASEVTRLMDAQNAGLRGFPKGARRAGPRCSHSRSRPDLAKTKSGLVGFRSDSWITNGSRKASPHGVITSQHRQRPGTTERLLKSIGHSRTTFSAYACSTPADFVRLLSRICSVVNSPPQTLQRQLGDAACAISCIGC